MEEDEFSKLQTKNILGQVLKDNFDTYFDDISPEKEVYELANDTILNKSEEKNKKFNAPNYKAEQIFLQNSLSAAATLPPGKIWEAFKNRGTFEEGRHIQRPKIILCRYDRKMLRFMPLRIKLVISNNIW